METFRKAAREDGRRSATVLPVGRLALVLAAAFLLAGGGAGAALLAPGSEAAPGTTTSATTTTTKTAPADTNVSTASRVVAFTGHGWGHGLGLSQWGAYGYAKHGWTYDRILAHYYPGTTLGPARVATLRVLVAQKKSVQLTATAAWSVVDGSGTKTALDPAAVTLDAKLVLGGKPLPPPLSFVSKEPLAVDGRAYRGKLTVVPDGSLLDVVNTVGLETYLKGVVPAEMPSAWPPDALEAQAVAARSYALANLAKGRPFDLYGDTRSQV
jgi:stage II sporulation protein D